jgi:hypothetical protein
MTKPDGPVDTARQGRFLTAKQLMDALDLSENTVYHALQFGFLSGIAVRCGKQWRVSADALDRLMCGGEK